MTLIDETESSLTVKRRDRVRGTILDAAEKVFTAEGESELSIRRVAEEIDYSTSAVYGYFRTKCELVDALKESFFARILDQIAVHRDSELPYNERARKGVAVYIHTALERPSLYAAAFSGVGEDVSEADLDEFAQSNKGRAFDHLRSIVEHGIETGELRQDLNASLAAKSLWVSCHGLAMLGLHLPSFPCVFPGDDDMTQQAFIDYHADQLMRGLEPAPARQCDTDALAGPGVRAL